MRNGVRLGVDVGSVRIGVARSDPGGLLATPVETVPARAADPTAAIARIVELAAEHEAVEIVVGLPRGLSGTEGRAAAAARAFAEPLAAASPVPVRLVDERLSTVSATAALRGSGVPGRKQRAVVDQAAAVVILQSALDAERSSGSLPGELVEVRR